jgi:trans-aconitate methyltransferase
MGHADEERPLPVWRTHLRVEEQDAARYPDAINVGLFAVIAGTPRRVLELGCARGAFGAAVKARFPGAHVTGVEAGVAPAEVAATRLDRVVRARLEDIDLAAHGVAPGELDLVVAADVLEHIVNPWDLLVRLKPFIARDGQVVASIPNVRNAILVNALATNGRWQYGERGLLDITHLRFFTYEEIRVMFEETGYRIDGNSANMSQPLVEVFQKNRGNEKVTLQMGRLTLADLTQRDLYELCTDQFLVRARPV